MKKLLAILVTMLMLFNIAAVSPVMADENSGILKGDYTFIDTCYSPDLGTYVAIAKDLSNSNTPAEVYVSQNGEDWEKTRSFSSAVHSANRANRQVIVWWEAEQQFVMSINNKLYISPDAYQWNEVSNTTYNGSNTTVETNGTVLVLSAGARVKILNNLTDDPIMYSIDSNAYGKTIGIPNDEPYTFAVTDQWKTWEFDAEGVMRSATPNLGAQPYDMAYVSSFGGWIVINGTAILRVLSQSEVKYTNFSSMKLSNGLTNSENFTSTGAGDANVAVGTKTGKIYVAPNDASSITVDTEWHIAEPGGATEENTEEIRSITSINDETFFAASETKIFMVMKSDEGWKYYDTSKKQITIDGETRIEVPEDGEKETDITAQSLNFKGEIIDGDISSCEVTSDLPNGIKTESIENGLRLIVDSSVVGGHDLNVRIETFSGLTENFTISVVNEDIVIVQGPDEMAIPRVGEPSEAYTYSAVVIATDGKEMDRTAVINVVEKSDGVVFDEDTMTFTVDHTATEGKVVFDAYSDHNPDEKTQKTVAIRLRRPDSIEITQGETSLYIPDSSTEKFEYTATMYDQIDKEMPNDKIVWSVQAKNIDSLSGITMNASTGSLNVANNAAKGTVTIMVAAAADDSVYAQQDIELMYTDLRMAKEDLSEVKINILEPVVDNLDLIKTGAFESVITWKSSNESIIKTDGTVIRPSREDKKVTLTATAKKNNASTAKKYELTVKKADNLCVNGDFSDGTYDGWQPIGETILTIEQDNSKNVLKSVGSGAYQILSFTNDSSFAYEASVKAASGKIITLKSKVGGEIARITADGTYQSLKGTYDYRKQNDAFEDEIYIECSDEMMIDYMKVYEITLEYNAVMNAVNKAVYSRSQSDIDAAKALLNTFYDLPICTELKAKVDKIVPISNSGSGGGGGGGGGAGSKPSNTGSSTNNISTPTKKDDDYEDELDTYLLIFKDMKNHWAREDVEYMGQLKIVSGNENGQFLPDNNISRAEFAALVTRTMGLEETEYENSFFDVVKEDWYSGYVQTVRSNDFMNGYDGLFNPHAPITREEIAKVIVAAYNSKTNAKLEQGKALYFNDLEDISYWAYDYIVEAVNLGFVNGVTEDLFAPKEIATRAQAVVMLKRVYEKLNPSNQQ